MRKNNFFFQKNSYVVEYLFVKKKYSAETKTTKSILNKFDKKTYLSVIIMTDSEALAPAPWPPLSNAEVCYGATFFNISSYGILETYESPTDIFGYALPLLELQIILIFVFIVLSHMFLRRIGIPQFVSHMLVS